MLKDTYNGFVTQSKCLSSEKQTNTIMLLNKDIAEKMNKLEINANISQGQNVEQ